MKTELIIKHINELRKANKNKWYSLDIDNIKIKGYNTWLQVFDIDGVDYSNDMQSSVKDFNEHIEQSLLKRDLIISEVLDSILQK
jgi:hypothetical protein